MNYRRESTKCHSFRLYVLVQKAIASAAWTAVDLYRRERSGDSARMMRPAMAHTHIANQQNPSPHTQLSAKINRLVGHVGGLTMGLSAWVRHLLLLDFEFLQLVDFCLQLVDPGFDLRLLLIDLREDRTVVGLAGGNTQGRGFENARYVFGARLAYATS